jgi:hypothetical protein
MMRLQNSTAILLTEKSEFLSTRQMSELLNYEQKQRKLIQRVLSNYSSRNYFSSFPYIEHATDDEKRQLKYWKNYRAWNKRLYPCYSGAVYKDCYGNKMQSLSASLFITFLFLRNDMVYSPENLYSKMHELQILGDLASQAERDRSTKKIRLFLEFLDKPCAIHGYHLKKIIDASRFRAWLHKISIMQEALPPFLLPIAYSYIGHIIFALHKEQARIRASFKSNPCKEKIPELQREPEISVTPVKPIPVVRVSVTPLGPTSTIRVSGTPIRPVLAVKERSKSGKAKIVTVLAGVAALVAMSIFPWFQKEEPEALEIRPLVAISIPKEPPI